MPIALKHLPSRRADKGRYVMRATFELFPSPLMGEGSGGGEGSPSSPIRPFPRQGGGALTYPCQLDGGGWGWG
jgi:hypothetical protein